MRQKLPESHGYAILVNDIGRTVAPGEEFDCDLPVPGCVPVEDADSPAGAPAGKGEGGGDKAAETASAPPGKPQAKGQQA
jgi:hypothetical protein